MKVLFVASGNNNEGNVDNLTTAQGISLIKAGLGLDYFPVIGRGLIGYWKAAMHLRGFLKVKKYDIVHAHFGWCGIVALIARRKEKVVVSFMGDDLLGSYKNGHYTLLSKCVAYVNKFLAKYFYDYNVVKSKNLHSEIQNLKNVSVVPNGVNFDVFFPMEKELARKNLGITGKNKIILFAANSDRPEKNYALAKKAFEKLQRKDVDLLVIYGISQENLNLYYNAADVILLTSVHEGSPNVIKEALVCNRPIVTTKVGDVEEHLKNISGCYITNNNPEEIASCLNKAMDYLEIEARNKVDYLKAENIARKIIGIYNTVLN